MKLKKNLIMLTRVRADLYVFLGGPRIPFSDIEAILSKPFYVVTGKYDDVYVIKTARAAGKLLDANVIAVGQYSLAGIGGIDPHYCISRVRGLLHSTSPSNVLVFSYMPALGYCDTVAKLNVRTGLPELKEFVDSVKPRLFVSLGNDDCSKFCEGLQLVVVSQNTEYLDLDLSH